MAFYYVKAGFGTRITAGAGTQQTGVFGSTGLLSGDVYADIQKCLDSNTLASGDFICVSHLSAETYVSARRWTITSGVGVISVDDTSAGAYKAGASVTVTEALTLNSTGYGNRACVFMGVDLSSSSYVYVSGDSSLVLLRDLELAYGQPTYDARIYLYGDGATLVLEDVDILPSNRVNESMFQIGYGAGVEWRGGTLKSVTNGPYWLVDAHGNSGGSVYIDSVILTGLASGVELLQIVNYSDDRFQLELKRCTMPASWSLEDSLAMGGHILVEDCDDGSLPINGYVNAFGKALATSSVFNSDSEQVQSQQMSFDVMTKSDTSTTHAFRLKLGAVYADFSTSKEVTVQLIHDAQGSGTGSRFLTSEAWIEVMVPKASGKARTLESTGGIPLDTGTTNPTSASPWLGQSMTVETPERITLSTTAGGGEGWAEVYFCVGVPSIASGDLYVSHDIEVA